MVEVVEMAGQVDTLLTYITPDAMRVESKNQPFVRIVRVKGEKVEIFTLDERDRTYSDMSQMASMMSAMALSVFIRCDGENCQVDTTVLRPTDEYKRIRGFRARKVFVYLGNLKRTAGGMAADIPDSVENWFVKDWKSLRAADSLRLVLMIRIARLTLTDPKAGEILNDLEVYLNSNLRRYGAPVISTTFMPNGLVKATRVEVKRENLKESLFSLPEGYRKR